MRRARLLLAAAALALALTACFGPKPGARFVAYSASEVTVAAGGAATVEATYEIDCRTGPGTTEDGCAYREDDGSLRLVSLHLHAGVLTPFTYFDPFYGRDVSEVGWSYLGHPHDGLPDGLEVAFEPARIEFAAAPGATATSVLTISVSADTPPGSYDVWVKGLTHAESSAEKIVVHVTEPGATDVLTGVIDGWDPAATGWSVEVANGDVVHGSGPVAADGSFAVDLPAPAAHHPMAFGVECTIDGDDPTDVGHAVGYPGVRSGDARLHLGSAGEPYLAFLLHVDRAATFVATCDLGDGYRYVYDYAFDGAGWYGVVAGGSAGDATSRYEAVPLADLGDAYLAY